THSLGIFIVFGVLDVCAGTHAMLLPLMARSTAEYEDLLERDPRSIDAFVALRRLYKSSRSFKKLAALLETRAGLVIEGDGGDADTAAELLYDAGIVALSELGEAQRGEFLLLRAIELAPHHAQAQARLKDFYRSEGRWIDYADRLELELASLARERASAAM